MNEEQTEASHRQPGVVKRLFVAHRLENPAIRTFPGIALGAVGGTRKALDSLRRLRKEVDAAVTRGFPEAEHGFMTHITLGKFNVAATRIIDEKLRDSEYPAQMAFRLDSELLESVQSPLGGEQTTCRSSRS